MCFFKRNMSPVSKLNNKKKNEWGNHFIFAVVNNIKLYILIFSAAFWKNIVIFVLKYIKIKKNYNNIGEASKQCLKKIHIILCWREQLNSRIPKKLLYLYNYFHFSFFSFYPPIYNIIIICTLHKFDI